MTPFWEAISPLSSSVGARQPNSAMGSGSRWGEAREARPPRLNVWGDAAIGFTGMDLETAARERIPILSSFFTTTRWP